MHSDAVMLVEAESKHTEPGKNTAYDEEYSTEATIWYCKVPGVPMTIPLGQTQNLPKRFLPGYQIESDIFVLPNLDEMRLQQIVLQNAIYESVIIITKEGWPKYNEDDSAIAQGCPKPFSGIMICLCV